ncbi:MAG: hypothetical protein JWN30_1402 [Bacilli bacterium]|nr:hypothetical protein [Bacilli bacterium]
MLYADDGVYDINLHQGLQLLDGQHALMYVRFRYDATSDYTRTERQRNFLKAVAQKMATPKGLLELPQLISTMAPYVHTNMSLSDMVAVGRLGLSVNTGSMESIQIPPTDHLTETSTPAAGDILLPDVYACVEAVHQKLGMTAPIDRSKIDQPQVAAPAPEPAPIPAGTNAVSPNMNSVNTPPASSNQPGSRPPTGSSNLPGSHNVPGSNQPVPGNAPGSNNQTGSGTPAGSGNQAGASNAIGTGNQTGTTPSGNQSGSVHPPGSGSGGAAGGNGSQT